MKFLRELYKNPKGKEVFETLVQFPDNRISRMLVLRKNLKGNPSCLVLSGSHAGWVCEDTHPKRKRHRTWIAELWSIDIAKDTNYVALRPPRAGATNSLNIIEARAIVADCPDLKGLFDTIISGSPDSWFVSFLTAGLASLDVEIDCTQSISNSLLYEQQLLSLVT